MFNGGEGLKNAAIEAEVRDVFERYEKALRAHDVETLNSFFLDCLDTVRFGIGEQNYGFDAIVAYRRAAAPVHPLRQLRHTIIRALGNSVACVSTEFTDPVMAGVGRQTQTWVLTPAGWKIIAAHVSIAKVTR